MVSPPVEVRLYGFNSIRSIIIIEFIFFFIPAGFSLCRDSSLRVQLDFGLYKILLDLEAFVHEPILRALPPPTCIARTLAILLHVYCAIYDAPPTPLVYAIHHTILVIAISCKGQTRFVLSL